MNVELAVGAGNWLLEPFSATEEALWTSLLNSLFTELTYRAIEVAIVIDGPWEVSRGLVRVHLITADHAVFAWLWRCEEPIVRYTREGSLVTPATLGTQLQVERSSDFVLVDRGSVRVADEAIGADGHHVQRDRVSLIADVAEGALDWQELSGVRTILAGSTVCEGTHVPLRLESACRSLHFFKGLALRAIVSRPASEGLESSTIEPIRACHDRNSECRLCIVRIII